MDLLILDHFVIQLTVDERIIMSICQFICHMLIVIIDSRAAMILFN